VSELHTFLEVGFALDDGLLVGLVFDTGAFALGFVAAFLAAA
jgi:hypothetical protein